MASLVVAIIAASHGLAGRAGPASAAVEHLRKFNPAFRVCSLSILPDSRPACGWQASRSDLASGAGATRRLSPLLHILHARERNPLGTIFGVAEVELVLGKIDRIAIDVVGDRRRVGRDEGVQLLAIVG